MFVLLVLSLMTFMIFTLVKNALKGIQLSASDSYHGDVELIIPLTTCSEFYLEPWMRALSTFRSLQGNNLRIHILIDGHHPAMEAWQELHRQLPFVELHAFSMRPPEVPAFPWMIGQIASQIRGKVVIIGDAELIPTESAFLSLAHHVSTTGKPFFVLPQTAHLTVVGEAMAVLNPTLALVSVFGPQTFSRYLSHPLMGIAQGWIGMPLALFKDLDFSKMPLPSWKQSITKAWDLEGRPYAMAFGEKHLMRHYPAEASVHIQQMKTYWEELGNKENQSALWVFAGALALWFFPIASFWFFPIWAVATLILLGIYRFFAKVVFQERWSSLFLHPVGCLAWVGTFLWWGSKVLRAKYGARGQVRS